MTSASTALNTNDFDRGLIDSLTFALDAAKASGADDASVLLGDHQGLSVSTRHGKSEDLEREEQRSLVLDVYLGKRKASIRLNDLSANALKDAAARAVDMAQVVPEDPYCGLPEAQYFSTVRDSSDLELNDDRDPSTQWMIDFAAAMETAAMETQGITNTEGAQVGWERSSYLLANSRGFLGGFKRSGYSGYTSPVAGEGEAMQSDYDWCQAVFAEDLPEPADVGREAARKAVARLGAGRIETGTMPIVFHRDLAGRMLSTLLSAVQGPSIARGTSFLRDQLGQSILPQGIDVVENPTRKRGMRSAPFDGVGMARQHWKPIADGVLNSWIMDLNSARQLGLESTGNSSFSGGVSYGNVSLVGGQGSFDDLIADIGHGFFITSVMGHGSNLLTGDYSQGASGFVIKDGKLDRPIENMTVAGHLTDMFKTAIFADDMRYRTGMDAPSMRINDLSVAGI